jgi:hydroxymethylbilane synthase
MLDKEIDMAVHSMKDMPAELPEKLMIGCTPKREDVRDALISKDHKPLAELKEGAIVGTSSLRRAAQILHLRPDVEIKWIRGNIDTRLRKLREEDYDAIILAAAGLKRMGWTDEYITEYLPEDQCIPAVGQGSLAIECREEDAELREMLQKLNDDETEVTVAAERAFLHKSEGGCQVPIAGFAERKEDGTITLTGLVGTPDGKTILKETVTGKDAMQVGHEVAEKIMAQGGAKIIKDVKEKAEQDGKS